MSEKQPPADATLSWDSAEPPAVAPLPSADPYAAPLAASAPAAPARRHLSAYALVGIAAVAVVVLGFAVFGVVVALRAGADEPSGDASAVPADAAAATGVLAFAAGEWQLETPSHWTVAPDLDALAASLPEGVEVIGGWTTIPGEDSFLFAAHIAGAGAPDAQLEQVARSSAAGIAAVTSDFSILEPAWSETLEGYREVVVRASGTVEGDLSYTQIGHVVALDDGFVYIVSTSQRISQAIGAADTVANSIRSTS